MDVKLKESLKIVGYYAFFGIWWILFSDRILSLLITDMDLYRIIQIYKGTFFILFTSFLLFKLIKKSYYRIEALDSQLKNTLQELKNNQAALEKLAYEDYLTGLATRRLLDEKYELLFESAKRSKTAITLVMLDIDYFKKYNDLYGHPEGDMVLKVIGKLLKKVFKREGDVVSRYGGEEFMVVLYETSLADTLNLLEEFRNLLRSRSLEHRDSPFGEVTLSVGIKSGTISPGDSSREFLAEVDKELYRAKVMGRNRCSIWRERSNQESA